MKDENMKYMMMSVLAIVGIVAIVAILGNTANSFELATEDTAGQAFLRPTDGSDGNSVDRDRDGWPSNIDCNDRDPNAYVMRMVYTDNDGDSFGGNGQLTCVGLTPPTNITTFIGGDCDDTSRWVNPNAYDHCNGVDNNCNGVIGDDFVPFETACASLKPCANGTYVGTTTYSCVEGRPKAGACSC